MQGANPAVASQGANAQKDGHFTNVHNVMFNMKIINYVQTWMGIVAGVVAGTLGLHGAQGFLFYAVFWLFVQGVLFLKAGGDLASTLGPDKTLVSFLLGDIGSQMMSFLLFWTFLYGLVHVYVG